jgi:xylose isomerase
LVKLLEDAQWPGMRHFDAHAYRTEDDDGVWDFARGCIRTYLILREKAQRFHADAEIQAALQTAMVDRLAEPALAAVTPDTITEMRRGPHDLAAMAARGYGLERLDQLVTELLLGTR